MGGIVKSNIPSDPTAREGTLRAYYSQHIELIDRCIAKMEPALQTYIRKGVTEGLSYRSLRARGYDEYADDELLLGRGYISCWYGYILWAKVFDKK